MNVRHLVGASSCTLILLLKLSLLVSIVDGWRRSEALSSQLKSHDNHQRYRNGSTTTTTTTLAPKDDYHNQSAHHQVAHEQNQKQIQIGKSQANLTDRAQNRAQSDDQDYSKSNRYEPTRLKPYDADDGDVDVQDNDAVIHQAYQSAAYQKFQLDNDQRIPIWSIKHMVNGIDEIDTSLANGANGIEADIQFEGVEPVRTNHGYPCDCLRTCLRSSPLDLYLKRVNELTTYEGKTNLSVLLLDLKLKPLNDSVKRTAGNRLAKVVVENLFLGRASRKFSPIKVIISINHVKDVNVVRGFYEFIENNNYDQFIPQIGWEVGMNDKIEDIGNMWMALGEQLPVYNIWQGDGLTNCVSPVINSRRLKDALQERERGRYINKIYCWTVDLHEKIRDNLRRGVDAILSNHPERLVEVLKEPEFSPFLRLANPTDDPFELITGHRMDHQKVKRNVQKTINHRRIKSFLADIKDSLFTYVSDIPKSIFADKQTGVSRIR